MAKIAVINDFVFCLAHGSEVCNKCYFDHRTTNNQRMKRQLSKAFPTLSEQDFLDRPPLSNALILALDSGGKDPSGLILYQCKLHNTANCKTCFDWINLAIANLKKASTRGNVIAIEATRKEKLGFLSSMGVELSPNTRLPEEAVDKRLRGAIDGAQYFFTVIDEVPVNPTSFSMWSKTDPKNKPLLLAVRRGNVAEVTATLKAHGGNPFPLYQNAFMDVWQTLMTLGKHFDDGHSEAVLQDKGHDYAICMRVLEVRKVAPDVPMFVVTYGRGTHNQPLSTTFGWISDVIACNQSSSTKIGFPHIISTRFYLPSFKLIQNASRLTMSPIFAKRKRTSWFPSSSLSVPFLNWISEGWRTIQAASFAATRLSASVPAVFLLNIADVVRFNSCHEVKTGTKVPSSDCQKMHWKEHKPMCVSLKGGTWHTVTVSTEAPEIRIASLLEGRPLVTNYINNQNPFHPSTYKSKTEVQSADPKSLPPNIHGDHPFLVKIQCPFNPILRSLGGSMLIYDRQRSFHAHLSAADDEVTYGEAMKQPEMATQFKIYRWAKRVGDRQLSICFDRPPSKDPLW